MSEDDGNEFAKDGHLFVCRACGKTSTTRYGFDADNKSTASPGWDESCMLNAQQFAVDRLVWSVGKTHVCAVNPMRAVNPIKQGPVDE